MGLFPSIIRAKDSIPAMDYSGTVVALGPSAPPSLCVGTKVFGMLSRDSLFRGEGTLCEYICISASKSMILPVPENLSMEEACPIACAGVMAFLICKHAGIKEGNGYRVFVNGASGGCGSLFVQAVLGMGAKEVVATCSAPNEELVKSFGVSRTIDYRKCGPLHEYLAKEYKDRPFDFILDTMGNQQLYTHSPNYLKKDGMFLNIGDYTHGTFWTIWYTISNTLCPTWLGGTTRKFAFFSGDVDRESEALLVRFIGEGKVKAVIDRTAGFEDVLDALDLVVTRRVRGRVVVRVEE